MERTCPRIYFTDEIQTELKKLDYKILDPNKRLEIVNEIVNADAVQQFYGKYGEIKVGAFNEILANYLCNNKVEDIARTPSSRKIEKIDDICKREDEYGAIKCYSDYRDHLRLLKKDESIINQKKKVYIDFIMGTVNDDIRTVHEACFPKVRSHGGMENFFDSDFDACDYTNYNHVLCIVTMPRYESTHPCFALREDIINIVNNNKAKFTKREVQIANAFYVYGGRSSTGVAELLNIPLSNVSAYVRSVTRKIVSIEISYAKRNEKRVSI